tara:strand:+ start:46 stop:1563 length:1518 start_codon:yes stop_codon:yes gene_type:complete
MATTQNNPYPYKDIPYNQSFWATVRLSSDITPEQLHELHLKHGHPTQSQTLGIPSLDGTGNGLPNPSYDLSMTPLTQDKFEISNFTIPEKTRANDVRYGSVGVNQETGLPDGVTMSGLPFQTDESSTVQTQQSPEGSYVPITGADLGLAPVLDLTTGQGGYDSIPNQLPYAPPGVTIDGPVRSMPYSGTPDWITNAQNPSPVNLPPYTNPMLSGQAYAGLISGGQAVPSMIAPGVSYSMDQPMGYTAPGASAVPFPSYQPPEGVVNNSNVNNPYPDYVDPYSIENRYYDAVTNQQERDALSLLSDYDRENVNLFALQDRIENPLENLSPEEILSLLNPAPVVDTRPATVSPLGSLDTTYINDIDFSGLLNTPNPQVDFPITLPEVEASPIVNQPIYQDPIMSMVEPVVNNDIVEPPPIIDTMGIVNNDFSDLGFNNIIGQPLEVTVPLPYSEPVDFEALAETLGLLGGSVPSSPNILPPSLLNSPVGSGFSPVVAATPSYGLLDR